MWQLKERCKQLASRHKSEWMMENCWLFSAESHRVRMRAGRVGLPPILKSLVRKRTACCQRPSSMESSSSASMDVLAPLTLVGTE